MLFADRQFVLLDPKIKVTCALAGCLKFPENRSDKDLKPIIDNIYKAILKNTQCPLVQIIPKDDWNAPYECMAIRAQQDCYTVPGMHLSGLYSSKTGRYFTEFLNKFLVNN